MLYVVYLRACSTAPFTDSAPITFPIYDTAGPNDLEPLCDRGPSATSLSGGRALQYYNLSRETRFHHCRRFRFAFRFFPTDEYSIRNIVTVISFRRRFFFGSFFDSICIIESTLAEEEYPQLFIIIFFFHEFITIIFESR